LTTYDSLIDTLLDGRYRVIRKLGTGGMASVYLAEDQELGRRVAIKLLDERHAQDEQFVERFRREAESAAGLSHPNIVSIYDRGEAEGTYYIAMEYLEGTTLKELLIRRGPTPVRVAIDYARQILQALDFSHRHGIVHRDIKPHNVVVAPDGRVKVTDFGIARSGSSQMTEAGSIIGTAQYLSPEQAQGKPVHPSSDLYSVGVVLYEMLTGTVPFTGETALEIAMKHLNSVPEPPSERRPPGIGEVPHEFDAVVLRALAKDQHDRYRTAREMDADLARVAQGLPVAHETETAATAVLAGAGLEEATRVVPAAARRGAARVPPHYGPAYDYEGRAPRRSWWPWLVAALLLGAAGYAGYFVYTKIEHQLSSSGTVSVPFVQGEVESLAKMHIEEKGLVAKISRQANPTVAAGTVFDQNPAGGDHASKGDTVLITVSTGKPKVEVPEVRRLSLTDAVAKLTEAGLKYHTVQVPSDLSPGTVTAQDPGPGTQVVKGTDVRLNVSKGLPLIPLPNVINDTQGEATNTLQQDGFSVAGVQQQNSDKAQGIVIGTNPNPGTDVQRGSAVTLIVSKGPATAIVPDVVGFPVARAVGTIRQAGFKTQVTTIDTANQADDGNVISQSPNGNTQEPLNSIVTIEVGHYVAPPPVTGPTGASGPTGAVGTTP